MAFLARYQLDESRPSRSAAARDLAVRALLPGVLLFLLIWGFGLLLTRGPLKEVAKDEVGVNTWLEDRRTSTWDAITYVFSGAGNTQLIIGTCVVAMVVLWFLTRQWWVTVIPLIAISLQSIIFFVASHLTDRERPDVEKLDSSPPTTSYPSGHTSAATALYVTLLIFATRIPNKPLRVLVVGFFGLMPLLVASSRVYRGMHHVTDVSASLVNGTVCAVFAWLYLRRDERGEDELDQTRA